MGVIDRAMEGVNVTSDQMVSMSAFGNGRVKDSERCWQSNGVAIPKTNQVIIVLACCLNLHSRVPNVGNAGKDGGVAEGRHVDRVGGLEK